jgi:hypothetical protein
VRTDGRRSGRRTLALVVPLVALASCTAAHEAGPTSQTQSTSTATAQAPVDVAWRRLAPVPGATSLSWVTSGGGEVLVSGLRGTGDAAPPGLWRFDGKGGWQAVELAPVTYYGRRADLFRVATDGRRVVALGRRIGGTHGNPRFTSWTGRPDRLHETQQPFELFGGPDAIAVTDLAMTDDGGVVIGAWAHHGDPSGVTVWMQDGETWRRFDEAPGIASEVTDVGSDLTSPAAITARGGEPVLVGWTVHLADGRVGLRASLWEHEGTVWHEVRLAADGDAVARAVTCPDACTVVGAEGGRLALWVVQGDQVRRVAAPAVPVGEREPVTATSSGSTVWVTIGEGTGSQALRVVDGQAESVSAPPGVVTALAGVADGVVAVVRASGGSTGVWHAG